MLRWIAFASRPLRVEEICEALIIDPDSSDEFPFDELPADVSARDVNGLMAVSLAMMLGHEHTVRLLIDKGADMTIKKDGVSLLHMTAGRGLGEIANLLITRRAAIDDLADDELATLHYAARGGDLAVAEVLIKWGADINIRGQGLVTPLHLATESGEAEMVQLLVRHGADPNIPDSDGLTAFHHSVACGYMEVAIFLLGSGGANPSLRDLFGRTALHLAVQQKQDRMVQFLIDGGAQADARDYTDMAPLHLAAVVSNTASAQILLENGADIMAGTSYSAGRAQRAIITRVKALLAQPESAPLAASLKAVIHLAVDEVQLPDAVRLSINRMVETIEFTPSISLGLSQSQRRIVSAFRREVFAILEAPDIFADDGWTPLHIAVFNGREGFVRLLAHKGALIDALTARGLLAIQLAANQGHGNVVQLLKEPGSATYLRRDTQEENRMCDKG
jgi:ankyrin repeat protein